MKNTAQRLLDWIGRDALPFWSTQGLIPGVGGSYETLYPSGLPNLAANMRVRIQARQIFVFARAHQMGWLPNAEPLVRSLDMFICQKAVTQCRSDGYAHLLSSSFEIVDAKRDLYDHAFFTLGYAAIFAAFGDKGARRKARKITDWVDDEWSHPAGGWREGDYAAPWRRQNPHMHWFETFLFLYDATKNEQWANKARKLFALFEQHFYDTENHILREYFAEDWTPASGEAGAIVEPGHMLEWVWLLRWYQKSIGTDTSEYANNLFAKALAIGLDAEGLVYDAVDAQGKVLVHSKRLWPMTELIKAAVAQAAAGVPDAEAVAERAIENLFSYYLDPAKPGRYIDKRGAQNEIADDSAPASTLYHLMVAATEVKRYCGL